MNKSKISELPFSRFINFFPYACKVFQAEPGDRTVIGGQTVRKEEFSNRSLECKLRKKVINYILQKSGLDFDIFPHTL